MDNDLGRSHFQYNTTLCLLTDLTFPQSNRTKFMYSCLQSSSTRYTNPHIPHVLLKCWSSSSSLPSIYPSFPLQNRWVYLYFLPSFQNYLDDATVVLSMRVQQLNCVLCAAIVKVVAITGSPVTECKISIQSHNMGHVG